MTITTDEEKKVLIKEVGDKVVREIGAICRLAGCVIVNKLPKTRSGKILRRIIRNILNQETYKWPATIDDPSALDTISDVLTQVGTIKPKEK